MKVFRVCLKDKSSILIERYDMSELINELSENKFIRTKEGEAIATDYIWAIRESSQEVEKGHLINSLSFKVAKDMNDAICNFLDIREKNLKIKNCFSRRGCDFRSYRINYEFESKEHEMDIIIGKYMYDTIITVSGENPNAVHDLFNKIKENI